MEKISQIYKTFLDTIKDIQTTYKFESEELTKKDQETQDLLHQLELGSYKERPKTTTKLAKVRKERRYSKDVISVLQPMVDLLATNEGIAFIKKLQIVLGDTRKIENSMLYRRYTPRVITDLEIANRSTDDK